MPKEVAIESSSLVQADTDVWRVAAEVTVGGEDGHVEAMGHGTDEEID